MAEELTGGSVPDAVRKVVAASVDLDPAALAVVGGRCVDALQLTDDPAVAAVFDALATMFAELFVIRSGIDSAVDESLRRMLDES